MKLPYGISDFNKIRSDDFVYVDKTPFIEKLESLGSEYLFFIRPRRFGKSLFLSMLAHYYDVNTKENFMQLFGELYIGLHPTVLKNTYLMLELDFSGLHTESKDELESAFKIKLALSLNSFMYKYAAYFTEELVGFNVNEKLPDVGSMLLMLLEKVKRSNQKIYLIIDEYDHFANDIIATGNELFYKDIVRAAGFVRDFYETVKIGTKSVIDRIFITGISPIMLDDMTSGFNISMNLTTNIMVNEMLGFTEAEVRHLILQIGAVDADGEMEPLVDELRKNYNGYLFSKNSDTRLYNPDMVLYFFNEWVTNGIYPDQLIDDNVRTDYGKLRRLMGSERNRKQLATIIADEHIVTNLVSKFSFDSMYDEEYFVSLLFYMGLLTITGTKYGQTELGIPNYVVRKIFWEYFERRLRETAGIEYTSGELHKAIWEMAYDGNLHSFVSFINGRVLKALSNRDLIQFDEKAFKVLLLAYLTMTNIYRPISEREVAGKFLDILLEKDFRAQNTPYEWLFELKYVKIEDRSSLQARVETVKQEGLAQLSHYMKSRELAGMLRLKAVLLILIGRDEVVAVELE